MRTKIIVIPRVSWSWKEFCENTPVNSIALDGMVSGGPRFEDRYNFDHHEGVIREITMSTARQIYFAIKGGFIPKGNIYVNDIDQDVSLACWLLLRHQDFVGTGGSPIVNRLVELDDRLDVTGGAFPMDLSDSTLKKHTWVFKPYTNFRKSGELSKATPETMLSVLESVLFRLDKLYVGEADNADLDTRHEVLHSSSDYCVVDEIGGNEARYYLFSKGLDAYISIISRPNDTLTVYTIGKRSRWIDFPVKELLEHLNTIEKGWGGSDLIGGSPRNGSKIQWKELVAIVDKFIKDRK